MFSPTLLPEEVLLDHPERIRGLIVEASNPILSFSDANAWREAFAKLDLSVVIDPAFTETARHADYVLPAACGYAKWEMAVFPKRYPQIDVQLRPPVVPAPAEALPAAEIYARLAEKMGIVDPLPDDLGAVAAPVTPEARAMFLRVAMSRLGEVAQRGINGESQLIFWGYRALAHHFPSPVLVAIACTNPHTNLDEHIGYADKRVRLAPAPMIAELERAATTPPQVDPDYPFVLAGGLRTRWTANTIQRDPAWRKGRGPHCELNVSAPDAKRLGIAKGDRVRIETRRGAIELPAAIDAKLLDGHVWMPNGFGMQYGGAGASALEVLGANCNEITDAADRDPFTGCPHRRFVRVKLTRIDAGGAAARP